MGGLEKVNRGGASRRAGEDHTGARRNDQRTRSREGGPNRQIDHRVIAEDQVARDREGLILGKDDRAPEGGRTGHRGARGQGDVPGTGLDGPCGHRPGRGEGQFAALEGQRGEARGCRKRAGGRRRCQGDRSRESQALCVGSIVVGNLPVLSVDITAEVGRVVRASRSGREGDLLLVCGREVEAVGATLSNDHGRSGLHPRFAPGEGGVAGQFCPGSHLNASRKGEARAAPQRIVHRKAQVLILDGVSSQHLARVRYNHRT